MFYNNTRNTVWIPEGKVILLSSDPNGFGEVFVDGKVQIKINGNTVYEYDFSNGNSGRITPLPPLPVNEVLADYVGTYVDIELAYKNTYGVSRSSSGFYLTFLEIIVECED